jgi:Kef-type K+ transport system membrane component KefB/nucleotide-binding universal stress UspA family protein
MPHLHFSSVTLLLLQIAAILVVSRLLGVLTRRLGQPLVIAEVTAGIVLGPSLLGWLWPEAMAAVFPAHSLDVLKMLSQVGLVLFMFLIGLELDPRLLRGRARASIAISHSSIAAPFALGALGAWLLHEDYAPEGVRFLPFLMFMGAAMSITAFPVLARILSERNLFATRVGTIAITCAAVDDVTAWCLLAFVVGVARSEGLGHALWTTGLSLTYLAVMLLVLRPLLQRLGKRVRSREGLTPNTIAFVLLLLLLSASATELIGIHALFGAFVMGAILPKEGGLSGALADKIESIAVVLLLPLFFAYSGLRTEIGLVDSWSEWGVTAFVILLATIGKFGGSFVAARWTGLRWREASAIGILMNTRGLMELIVLNIGMDLGVISPTLFTMMVLMALVTTVATTPILKRVYPDSELKRDRTEASEGEPRRSSEFKLLMCVSDRSTGPALATVAATLLGDRRGASELLALHLRRPSERPSQEVSARRAEKEHGALGPLLSRGNDLGLAIEPIEFVTTEPSRDICATANARDASLVLMGSHRPLVFSGHLGGTVNDVVRQAGRPVAVLLDRGLARVERVLVAYAGGAEDREAIALAHRMESAPNVRITLLHVVEPGEHEPRGRAQVAEVFEGAPPEDDQRVKLRVVEHDSPPDAVLAEAANGYDLIVIGMNARWGTDSVPLATKRRRVLSESPVSILVVHSTAPTAD